MVTSFNVLKRKVAKVTLFFFVFSLLSPLTLFKAYALSGTFTTTPVTANVSEVKASRTLTVGATPANAETITVGTCTVTFTDGAGIGDNSASIDDTDCTGGATINNYTLTNPGVLRTTSELADVLDTLTNVSDAAHGALTVGTGAATTTVFTTTGTETSATDITFTDGTSGDVTATTTVTGVIPVAQVTDFTPAIPTDGETYRATINGTNYDHTVVGVETVQDVVEALQPLMNGNAAVTCTEDDAKVTCTADTAGTAFLFAATVVDITSPTIAEFTAVTPTITNNNTPSYTFSSTETGAITYAGGCTSTTTGALVGNNTISFSTLADGTYAGCTIRVTDGSSNQSNLLSVTSFTVDTTAPTVALTTPAGNPTNAAFTVTATFNEPVTGVTGGDFVVSNASTGSFNAVSSTVYTIVVTPTTDGPVTVDMPAAAGIDAATNTSTAATQLTRTYDVTAPTVALSTPAANPTNAPFTVTATFNEPVTGVLVGDFVVSNATTSSFTGVSSTVYTVLVSPIADGAVTVDMPAAAATDLAGNASLAATQLTRNFDGTPPTPVLSTPAANPTNAPFTVTATFNEPVTGVTGGDFIVTNASTGSFNAVSSTVYTILVSPTTDGPVTIDMPASAAQDGIGNLSNAATQLSRTYDGTDPTVVLSTPAPTNTNAPFTVTATFSETVTGVTSSDFAVVNGSKTSFTAVSGTVYTVLVTPSADGPVTVDMPIAAAADTATNTSTAAAQLTRNYDGTAPIISETTAVVTPRNDNTPSYTFTSDEVGTISYSGGCTSPTTTAVVGANTISFSTLVDGTYPACTVTVTDASTNVSNILSVSSFTIDTVVPTVTLSTPASASTNAPFTVTATFSETVSGVLIGDFVVTNATTSAFTALSGTGYTVLVTPTSQGTVTVNMPAAAASDAATNTSSAATQLSRIYDSVSPTVVLSAPSSATNAPFTATATFSETVSGVLIGDFAVTNATTSAFTGSGNSYSVLVTPTAQGAVTVDMAAAAASDAATNTSSAATQLSVTYDTTVPSVVLSTSASNPTSSAFTVTATFSEAMTGVTVNDFTVVNGTKGGFNSVSSSVYTFTISPTTDGTVTADMAAATATDLAGNDNTASNQISLTYNRPSGGGGGGGGGAPATVVKTVEKTQTGSLSQTGATTQTGAVTETGSLSQTGATDEEVPTPKNTFAEILEKALKDRENSSTSTSQGSTDTPSQTPTGSLGTSKYINALIQKGAVNTTVDSFRPNDDITRAELLKIVMKANGIDYSDTQPNTSKFTDLDPNDWSSKVATKAAELGITNGYDDGTFKPNAPITRVEAIKFTLKVTGIEIQPSNTQPFTDVPSGWQSNYISTAKELGIVSGTPAPVIDVTDPNPISSDGIAPTNYTQTPPPDIKMHVIFQPDNTLTRAEAAKIIIRTVDTKNSRDS